MRLALTKECIDRNLNLHYAPVTHYHKLSLDIKHIQCIFALQINFDAMSLPMNNLGNITGGRVYQYFIMLVYLDSVCHTCDPHVFSNISVWQDSFTQYVTANSISRRGCRIYIYIKICPFLTENCSLLENDVWIPWRVCYV